MVIFKSHIAGNAPYKGGSTRIDGQVHKMSSNENPLGPSPMALQAIQAHLHQLHEYEFQDDQPFIEKLSCSFKGQLAPEQFLPANSGMELLDIVCRGFLDPGSSCILSSPTFMAYKNFAELSGARVIDKPLLQPDFSLDVKGILESVDESTRLIFVANPNNPTGGLFCRQHVDELMQELPPHVVVLYDEAYAQYVEENDYPRAMDYIQQGKPIIGLHSFSKIYGLAGMRLGYIFSTPEISNYLRNLRRPFMVNTLSMVAGMAALDDREHLHKTVALNRCEKTWLYHQFDLLGIQYWESEANFILVRPEQGAQELTASLLQQGIMVRPTHVMGAPDCVRITVSTRAMNEALIRAIGSIG